MPSTLLENRNTNGQNITVKVTCSLQRGTGNNKLIQINKTNTFHLMSLFEK